ncbi:MAG: hypothetical protein WCA11_13250, partial [Terracidiphilus sp.]
HGTAPARCLDHQAPGTVERTPAAVPSLRVRGKTDTRCNQRSNWDTEAGSPKIFHRALLTEPSAL